MPELQVAAPHRDQPGPLGGVERPGVDPEGQGGPGDQSDVLGVVGGRDEQDRTRILGQASSPLVERGLELLGQRQPVGQRFGPRELGVGQRPGAAR
jgi:hypothetical protein